MDPEEQEVNRLMISLKEVCQKDRHSINTHRMSEYIIYPTGMGTGQDFSVEHSFCLTAVPWVGHGCCQT